MVSWLKYSITMAAVVLLFIVHPSLYASNDKSVSPKTLLESFYPDYPPTSSTTPEQEALIKKGEYLAKMGDCISCHTNVKGGGQAYAGGLSIATPFGTFYSPNITPDKKTGIGNWSEDDFIRALKEGKDPKGRNYFPVFPYVYFANTTDDDLRALYAYFMSIPAVEQENKILPFPFSVPGARTSLLGWKLLFFYPNSQLKPDPKQSDAWNRGQYIVDGLGHCSMCHTPLNPLGSPKNRYYLTGGFIDGHWAPNITQKGLETATLSEVVDVFAKNELINNAGTVTGPMAEVNHNSLRYLTKKDQLAIATYLKSVVSEEPNGLPPSNEPPSISRGKQVYLAACVLCHQNGEMTAPLIGDGANWYRRLQDSDLQQLYHNAVYGYNSMPVKGACVTCSKNDIISAVDYILDQSLSRSQRIDLERNGKKTHTINGQAVYNKYCSACHNNQASKAPLIGDTKVWNKLIEKNMDVLVENTVKGSHHPINGGCKTCSTAEIIDAIKYILEQSNTKGNYSLW